jgi:uncharacterized protein involved in type VI secretion and phage assembly
MSGRSDSNGIVTGIVADLKDPAGLGRVRVRYPHLDNQLSDWTRLAAPMAGAGRGTFFRPEKDDEVLVGFEHGDPRRPYVLGSLWSSVDKPPPDDGDAEKNNWRFIQSRAGHILLFDDTQGKERILLIDKDGQRQVLIDSANSKIQVLCQQGNVEVKAAAGDVTVEGVNVTVKGQASLKLESDGPVTIKGSVVNIN